MAIESPEPPPELKACESCPLYEPCKGGLNPFRSMQRLMGVIAMPAAIEEINEIVCKPEKGDCLRFEAARSLALGETSGSVIV